MISAVAARALGASTNVPNQEELFLVALLQDIGMLALDKVMPDAYSKMQAMTMGRCNSWNSNIWAAITPT